MDLDYLPKQQIINLSRGKAEIKNKLYKNFNLFFKLINHTKNKKLIYF